MEKQEIEVSFDKCQSCAYLLPKKYFCERYLRGAETAVYLCSFCRVNENEEMSKVCEMEMEYGKYLND